MVNWFSLWHILVHSFQERNCSGWKRAIAKMEINSFFFFFNNVIARVDWE